MSTDSHLCKGDEIPFTGNVEPILNEVRHALARLIESGERTVIDLGAIPLAPGEETAIGERLGTGEVSIRIDALGPSEILESAYPGVWRVTHYNTEGEILGKYIEVARVPEIVVCPEDDMSDAFEALTEALAAP